MAGCSSWVAPTTIRTTRPRRCTTRPPGPGPPPGACSSPTLASRPQCCPTARCSWGMSTAPSCTTPTAGPGRPPGTMVMTAPTMARPRCCSMARSSWRVARARRSCTSLPASRRHPRCEPRPPAGAWIATGTMGTPRSGHTAVRLLDGRVLVVGGATADENDDLRGVVRPGHRDLVRHREHAQAPRWLPGHVAARRQGARRGCRRPGRGRPDLRRRGVRPGQRDVDRHRADDQGRCRGPPRYCATAGCSSRAAMAPLRAVRPRQRDVDRHGEDAHTEPRATRPPAARWQGARGRRL